MKGFLTFTLAAGVAITTGSIAQAAGITKAAASATKAPAAAQGPMGVTGMGLTLDRISLSRELDRLAALLNPVDGLDDGVTSQDDRVQPKVGTWTY